MFVSRIFCLNFMLLLSLWLGFSFRAGGNLQFFLGPPSHFFESKSWFGECLIFWNYYYYFFIGKCFLGPFWLQQEIFEVVSWAEIFCIKRTAVLFCILGHHIPQKVKPFLSVSLCFVLALALIFQPKFLQRLLSRKRTGRNLGMVRGWATPVVVSVRSEWKKGFAL